MMRAGFEGDIGCGAARAVTRFGKRLGLGMRPAADGGDAAPYDNAITDDQRGDGGIRRGQAEMAAREPDRGGHEAAVGLALPGLLARFRHRWLLLVLVAPQLAEHLVEILGLAEIP